MYKRQEYALYVNRRMNQTIIMPEVNAYTLGQLMFLLEMTTAYEGERVMRHAAKERHILKLFTALRNFRQMCIRDRSHDVLNPARVPL